MRRTRFTHALLPVSIAAITLAGCASSGPSGIAPAPGVAETFAQRVTTLSSDEFGGRAPGTPGIERAARFIESELQAMNVEPLPGGWRLPFEVSGELEIHGATFDYEAPGVAGQLKIEEQFNPLGISGEGRGEGTLAFVGYGIEDGPGGYTSFPEDADLTGKIAVLLRFEPLDAEGNSRWLEEGEEGWSHRAGLRSKFDAVLDRNPAGIVFVSPPGANDPRINEIPDARSTRFGNREDVPVVGVSTEAVARLIELADHEGRSLMDLRKAADEGEVSIVDLSAGRVSLDVSMSVTKMKTSNIAGVIPGQGELADEWVVIGAHYDHLGMGDAGTSRAPKLVGKEIHHGADDNASGVAGVLQAASELRARYDALPEDASARSVLLLFFSAEETGLLGSKDFIESAPVLAERITAMFNLDMIGRLRTNDLTVHGVGTAEEFDDLLPAFWDAHGFDVKTTRGGLGPSDHASFYRGGIPVLAFFTGLHTDYHTPSDTADKINSNGGARIASLVADLTATVAQEPKLTYVEIKAQRSSAPRTRSKVRLGFMPGSYDETERGAMVGEVLPGSPAEQAGLRQGDRIVSWNGEEIANIFGYMSALGGHQPGDVVRIGIERDGEEIELTATLGASQRQR